MRLIALLSLVAITSALAQQAETVAEQSRAASDALRAGDYTKAAALYRKLAAALPGNPGPRFNLGLALEKSGHPGEAAQELGRVVEVQPDFAPAWFLLGLAYQQAGKPSQAIEPLRKAVLLDPKNQQAQLELADAELASGDPRRAADDFRSLANDHPEMAKAWQGLGFSYAALGEHAAERIERIAAHTGYWRALMARERAGTGKLEEGLRLYEEALEQTPGLPGLHAARSAIYRELKQPDRATAEEQMEAGLPKPDCGTHAAACLYLSRDWPGALTEAEKSATPENLYWAALGCGMLAEEAFERVGALPESAEIHELLAESDQRMGRRVEAVREWREALRAEPGDRRIQGRLGESLFRNREYEEAERLLKPLVAAQPENAEWQYLLGSILLEQRRGEAALPHLALADRLSPGNLRTADALGRAYLELGQFEKAVAFLEKARPLDDGGISFALSTAYRRLGREEDAKTALKRYRDLTSSR